MAFDVWPVAVPNEALFQSPYSEQPDSWKDKFEVEEGPPLEGPTVSSYSTDVMSYEMHLTQTQWAALITFWRTTLAQGVKYFTATHPIAGTTGTFKFVEEPTASRVQTIVVRYRVTISVRRFNTL